MPKDFQRGEKVGDFFNDPANVEFRELLNESGWIPAEAGRQLSVTSGVVSQYINGLTRPSRTVIKLLKHLLAKEHFQQGPVFREQTPVGDVEIWRRRAKSAELRLANLRSQLRKLLEESADNPPPPPQPGANSAKGLADAKSLAVELDEEVDKLLKSPRKKGVGGPSEGKSGPPPVS